MLPAANACFNSCSAVALAAVWLNIKRGNRTAHARCMLAAVAFSGSGTALLIGMPARVDTLLRVAVSPCAG